jgi:uncharacterized protein (DUF952 family)
MMTIYHIAIKDEWEQVETNYAPDSLQAEGFIHCSTAEQVPIAANNHFRGQTGLVLLEIDPTKISDPIIYEDLYETGIEFPHIYGALPVAAVRAIHPFEPSADGTFHFTPA